MEHWAQVSFTVQPGYETEEDGEILQVPSLACWMIICSEHQAYTAVTIPEPAFEKLGTGMASHYLAAQRKMAEMELQEMCGASVPALSHWPQEAPTNH